MNERDSKTLLKAIALICMWGSAVYMVSQGNSNLIGAAIIMTMFII